jgi:tetratricopeptide (TPR) repeat protein
MKKGIIGIIAFFSLLVIAGAVFADAEYDAALRAYAGKNYKEAAVDFRAYVEKKPDPAAYYLLGYSLYKLGRFNEATEYFKQAYLIDPTFSPETGLAKEFPRVRTAKTGKKTHRPARAQGQREKAASKKQSKARRAAHKKCPASPEKSGTKKSP